MQGWIYDTKMTLSLRPGEFHSLWMINHDTRVRVDLTSSSRIEAGMATREAWAEIPTNRALWLANLRNNLRCQVTEVTLSSLDCSTSSDNANLYVLDQRNMQDAANAAASRLLGNRNAGGALLEDNVITATLFHWGCVQNCMVRQ
jgi:hypothetical protein